MKWAAAFVLEDGGRKTPFGVFLDGSSLGEWRTKCGYIHPLGEEGSTGEGRRSLGLWSRTMRLHLGMLGTVRERLGDARGMVNERRKNEVRCMGT